MLRNQFILSTKQRKSNYPVIGIQTLIKTIYTQYSTSLIENILYKRVLNENAGKMTKLEYQHFTTLNEN